MLGIRLSTEDEQALERHARAIGRGKSTVAREWIVERLKRESVDEQMRRASAFLSAHESLERLERAELMSSQALRDLDAEDGGYDWGAHGAPV